MTKGKIIVECIKSPKGKIAVTISQRGFEPEMIPEMLLASAAVEYTRLHNVDEDAALYWVSDRAKHLAEE